MLRPVTTGTASQSAVGGGEFFGGRDGVAVELGGELGLAVVAAAVEDGDGDAVFDEGGEEDFVAALDVFQGKVHLAEAVVAVVVGAGDPDDEVGGEGVERGGEGAEELFEIHFALDVADGFHVEGAADLVGGVVFADVDGVGEDAGVAGEDGSGAVALVGVGIDDHDFDVGLLVLEVADGDGDVVEDAVALAVLAEGVVGAAGEADADALSEGGVAGEAGGLDLGGAAAEEAGGGGQAEEDLFFAVKHAGLDFVDVFRLMDALEEVDRGGLDLDDFLGAEDAALQEHVLGDAEFVHGEGVSRRQFQLQFLRVKAAHPAGDGTVERAAFQ
jgi:hypothetical protein